MTRTQSRTARLTLALLKMNQAHRMAGEKPGQLSIRRLASLIFAVDKPSVHHRQAVLRVLRGLWRRQAKLGREAAYVPAAHRSLRVKRQRSRPACVAIRLEVPHGQLVACRGRDQGRAAAIVGGRSGTPAGARGQGNPLSGRGRLISHSAPPPDRRPRSLRTFNRKPRGGSKGLPTFTEGIERPCERCQQPFASDLRHRYCSRACRFDKGQCSVSSCDRRAHTQGLCKTCYSLALRRRKGLNSSGRPIVRYSGECECGKAWRGLLPNQKFCSRRCQKRAADRARSWRLSGRLVRCAPIKSQAKNARRQSQPTLLHGTGVTEAAAWPLPPTGKG